VAVGALMIAKGMMLVFAGDPQAAYATGGTLKPPHAVAMHAILVLPALAWLSSFANWSERRRVGIVLVASAGYVTLTAAVAAGTYMGGDWRHWPAGMIALLAAAALSLLASSMTTLSAAASAPTARGIQHS
jgi:hypothetical protein